MQLGDFPQRLRMVPVVPACYSIAYLLAQCESNIALDNILVLGPVALCYMHRKVWTFRS